MSWSCACFVFIWQKRLHQCYVTVHLSLSVFVGFSFGKSFNIFVGEGHESFTCRIFGCFFWCTARGRRNLLVAYFFFSGRAKRKEIENYEIRANRCQKWRERRHVTLRKLIGRRDLHYKNKNFAEESRYFRLSILFCFCESK